MPMSMELKDSGGGHRARIDSIIGFLVYSVRTYRDMNPYFKGLNLTLDIQRPYIYEEGWIFGGGGGG